MMAWGIDKIRTPVSQGLARHSFRVPSEIGAKRKAAVNEKYRLAGPKSKL